MKLFIHASSDSSNSNVVNTVYVTMNVYMPYIKISAATDDELENIIHRSIINPRTDKPYSSLYRALLDQIIKYNKMNLRHRWEFTNNLLTTGDYTDFEIVFSENGEDKVVLKFLYSKGRFTVTLWKSFSSKKEIVNMMIGDNKINPFGLSELTKLFDKFIEPAIYKIDNM